MIPWMIDELKSAGYTVELEAQPKGRTRIVVCWRNQRAYYNVCVSENTAIRKAFNYLMDKRSKNEVNNQAFLDKASRYQAEAHAVLVEWGVRHE